MVELQRGASQSVWRKMGAEGRSEPKCRIMVLGIGGAGNQTVNELVESGLTGAECVAINTDLRDLNSVRATRKILIGESVTRGLGTGGDHRLGVAALEESRLNIENLLKNVDVVFVAASLGSGTGRGAAPLVADIARRKGSVVIGVVISPLRTEECRVDDEARALNELRRACDTVVVIDNNKIMELIPKLSSSEAFKATVKVLVNMISDIVETLSSPSLINLDFADFKTVVKDGGVAVVGVGESNAPNRAEEAVQSALRSPLIDIACTGAKGALVQISGDSRMTVEEVNRVREIVTETIGHNASVTGGARVNPQATDNLKVTLLMTGLHSSYRLKGFGDVMPKLYDIESPDHAPEKSLRIDLGLDQMENFED